MNVIGTGDAATGEGVGLALMERPTNSDDVVCEWCGLRTGPAPACARCGSPLSDSDPSAISGLAPSAATTPIAFLDPPTPVGVVRTPSEPQTAPPRRPDSTVIRPMIGQALCPWCSRFTPAGPACATCGSPLPISSRATTAPVTEDGSSGAGEQLARKLSC